MRYVVWSYILEAEDEGGGDTCYIDCSDEFVDSFNTIEEAEEHQKKISSFHNRGNKMKLGQKIAKMLTNALVSLGVLDNPKDNTDKHKKGKKHVNTK